MESAIKHANIETALRWVVQTIAPSQRSFIMEVRDVTIKRILLTVVDTAQVETTDKFSFAVVLKFSKDSRTDGIEELASKATSLGFKDFSDDSSTCFVSFCGNDTIKTGQVIQSTFIEILGLSFAEPVVVSTTDLGLIPPLQRLTGLLLQAVQRCDAKLPDSPFVKDFLIRKTQVQQEANTIVQRLSKLSPALIEYQELEKLIRQQQAEVTSIGTAIEKLAPYLGKGAYIAYMAGHLPRTPDYDPRIALQERIESLQSEHQSLSPDPGAGFFAKAKAMAQQLIVAGKLQIEKIRVSGTESTLGKTLIELNRDSELESPETSATLAELLTLRERRQTQVQCLADMQAKIENRKQVWTADLELVFTGSGQEIALAIKESEQRHKTLNANLKVMEDQFVNQLPYDATIQPGTRIGDLVERLRKLKRETDTQSSPKLTKPSDAGPTMTQIKKVAPPPKPTTESWRINASEEFPAFTIINEAATLQFENWRLDDNELVGVVTYEPSLFHKIDEGIEMMKSYGLSKFFGGKTTISINYYTVFYYDKDGVELNDRYMHGPSEFKQGNKQKITIILDMKKDLAKVIIRNANYKRK